MGCIHLHLAEEKRKRKAKSASFFKNTSHFTFYSYSMCILAKMMTQVEKKCAEKSEEKNLKCCYFTPISSTVISASSNAPALSKPSVPLYLSEPKIQNLPDQTEETVCVCVCL